jgi:hypothetical protein
MVPRWSACTVHHNRQAAVHQQCVGQADHRGASAKVHDRGGGGMWIPKAHTEVHLLEDLPQHVHVAAGQLQCRERTTMAAPGLLKVQVGRAAAHDTRGWDLVSPHFPNFGGFCPSCEARQPLPLVTTVFVISSAFVRGGWLALRRCFCGGWLATPFLYGTVGWVRASWPGPGGQRWPKALSPPSVGLPSMHQLQSSRCVFCTHSWPCPVHTAALSHAGHWSGRWGSVFGSATHPVPCCGVCPRLLESDGQQPLHWLPPWAVRLHS